MRKLNSEEVMKISGGLTSACGPSLGGFIYYMFTDCVLCSGGEQYCF